MEIRKVQKTGGSSFIVTLPKDWIKKLKIKEKDLLGIISQPDGTLLITADFDKEKIKRQKLIEIEDDIETDYLMRCLIGSYIMGFNLIQIHVKSKKLSPKIRRTITQFIQSIIGLEIIDETLNSIIIKDLLNPTEMPFNKSIKRMNIGVQNMHEDLMIALSDGDKQLVNDVISRDAEINRRHRLIARQSNMILHDIILAQKMEVTLEDAHHYFLISKQLERVGDHAKIIGENVLALIDKELDKHYIKSLIEISEMSISTLRDSLEAWEKRNLSLANDCIEHSELLKKKCDAIIHGEFDDPDVSLHIGYIVESIARTGEYAVNIAEIVFDNLLKD